jgi:hypothetical protein
MPIAFAFRLDETQELTKNYFKYKVAVNGLPGLVCL